MLGKWLRGTPRLLVLQEPTRAVDVGARRDLLDVLFRAARSGAGVLVAGMDASELQSMCDRGLIMRDGGGGGELRGGDGTNQRGGSRGDRNGTNRRAGGKEAGGERAPALGKGRGGTRTCRG